MGTSRVSTVRISSNPAALIASDKAELTTISDSLEGKLARTALSSVCWV